ncbi:MAG: TonB-dependent receptor [Phycisphaerae bacterium]|nr:TonB-dependent receptor [Phycisphaerae bacterium]
MVWIRLPFAFLVPTIIAIPRAVEGVEPPKMVVAGQSSATQSDDVGDVIEDETLGDIELLTLEVPMVVMASRSKGRVETAPYAVSVITAEDIRRSGARSIPDALRLVPGVDVAEQGYANAAVSPRGLHSFFVNQTLILVDGRQIIDSLYGGALWASWPFQIEDIERIEVVRGPGGVAWGSSTNNGVINIVTKDPIDQLGLTVAGMGGSRGMQKEHLGYAFSEGPLRMRVSGEYEGSDGFETGGSLLRDLDDDYKIGRSNVHAIYDATSNDTLTFSGGNGTADGVSSLPAASGFFNAKNSSSQASYLMSQWQHRIRDDNEFTLTGFVNDYYACAGMKPIDYRYQQLALQFSHTFTPAENHVITWGIDNRVDLVDASSADPFMLTKNFVSTDVAGIYIQDEWKFAPKWTLSLGGRWDYDSYGGFQPSGRAALSYTLTDRSLLYGAVSRAFAMPPGAMRFNNVPQGDGVIRTTADRDIDPMTMIAYEIGYRGKPFDRLHLGIDLYAHGNADVRAMVPHIGPPGLLNANIENAGDLWLYGVELEARYALTDQLTLLGNYTFQICEADLTLPFHYTDFMTPPKQKFMTGLQYDVTDDLHLSAYAYYVSGVTAPNPDNPFMPQRIDPYVRLDLRAEQSFWKDQASIAVGVRNLTDRNHQEGGTVLVNNAEVPRMVYAELRFRFK